MVQKQLTLKKLQFNVTSHGLKQLIQEYCKYFSVAPFTNESTNYLLSMLHHVIVGRLIEIFEYSIMK